MKLLLPVTLLTLSAAFAGNAQLRPRDRFPITTDQVAAKLVATFAQKGITLHSEQIALSASVTATEEAPALEVRSVEKLGSLRTSPAESTSSAVKLACFKASVCLPFYAVVTQSGVDGNTSLAKNEPQIASDTSLHAAPLVKSGEHVTLLVDSGTAHIQMSVVSMQSGALNQQIKVRSVDHKQIFSAQVISATVVKGTL